MRPGQFDENTGEWVVVVPGQEWYSVQDASIILGVGGPSVYSAINRGSITAYKVGGSTRIKHEDLVQYIERRGTVSDQTLRVDDVIQKIVPSANQAKKAATLADDVLSTAGRKPDHDDANPATRTGIQLDLFDDA